MDKASLRVLHIIPAARWSENDATLPALIRTLHTQHAIDSHVCLLADPSAPSHIPAGDANVSVFRSASPGRIYRLLRTLERESGRFHIVHTQGCRAGLIGAYLSGRTQAVAVRTLGHSSTLASGWKNHVRSVSSLLCTRMQKAVVCSVPAREEYSLRHTRIRVEKVDTGIDIADLEIRANETVDASGFGTGYHVGFAGPLTPDKQLDMFLATAYAVNRDRPGQFLFHVFGDGESRAVCESFSRRHGLSSCVFFHGDVPFAPWLRHMDALMICAHTDTVPVPAIEAMAMGVSVVARASGALPGLLEYGACGTLVHEHAPHAYATALLALINDPAPARKRAAMAALYARRLHNLSRVADTYARLFRSLNENQTGDGSWLHSIAAKRT